MLGEQLPIVSDDDVQVKTERAADFGTLLPGNREQFRITVRCQIANEA